MIQYREVIKKSKSYNIIEQDCIQNRIAHSYMVISEDSESLDEFITIMLQAIYCKNHNSCGNCNECIRLEHNNNPNVYKLKKEGTIKVEDIKELIADTYIAPIESNYKVYVIYNADTLNEAGQNKLLKTIEEPTSGVIIILAVSSDSAMLQTIKSRTKKIYLNIWNNEDLAKELSKIDTNPRNVELATKFCKGNITLGKALLTDESFQNCHINMINLLTNFTSTALLGQYVQILGNDKDQIAYSMSIIEGIISDTISDISNNIPCELAKTYSINTLANITDLIIDTNKRLASNCNPQAVATNFLIKLAEIKYLTATTLI